MPVSTFDDSELLILALAFPQWAFVFIAVEVSFVKNANVFARFCGCEKNDFLYSRFQREYSIACSSTPRIVLEKGVFRELKYKYA